MKPEQTSLQGETQAMRDAMREQVGAQLLPCAMQASFASPDIASHFSLATLYCASILSSVLLASVLASVLCALASALALVWSALACFMHTSLSLPDRDLQCAFGELLAISR